jgi:hypothetical protein
VRDFESFSEIWRFLALLGEGGCDVNRCTTSFCVWRRGEGGGGRGCFSSLAASVNHLFRGRGWVAAGRETALAPAPPFARSGSRDASLYKGAGAHACAPVAGALGVSRRHKLLLRREIKNLKKMWHEICTACASPEWVRPRLPEAKKQGCGGCGSDVDRAYCTVTPAHQRGDRPWDALYSHPWC